MDAVTNLREGEGFWGGGSRLRQVKNRGVMGKELGFKVSTKITAPVGVWWGKRDRRDGALECGGRSIRMGEIQASLTVGGVVRP